MRLIVDTNVLISALIKDSAARKLIMHLKAKLCSPMFLQEEIDKYKNEIIKKSSLNETELRVLFNQIKSKIIFLEYELFSLNYSEAENIMNKICFSTSVFTGGESAISL